MKDIDQITELVNSIDLDPILYSLMYSDNGPKWNFKKAKLVEKWYRQFLILCSIKPSIQLVPTKSIDIFWHTHILNTKKYIKDCDAIFNEYLHHCPHSQMKSKKDIEASKISFKNTLSLFENYFQNLPHSESADCGDSCDRGRISDCGNKPPDDDGELNIYLSNTQLVQSELPNYIS